MTSLRSVFRKIVPKGKDEAKECLFRGLPLVGASACVLYAATTTSEGNVERPTVRYLVPSLHLPSPLQAALYLIHLPHVSESHYSSCEGLLEVETAFPRNFNESDRFFQVLEYHRTLLADYMKRWGDAEPPQDGHKSWPRKVPHQSEISALEMDYTFCKRSPNYRNKDRACQDLQFRIGSYYITKYQGTDNGEMQMKGYKMIKDLAEQGHPDGMCYYGTTLQISSSLCYATLIFDSHFHSTYSLSSFLMYAGIILNEGLVQGIDANPVKAVVWWSRCLDFHKHIWATYELAVALYTGEGVPEDTVRAVSYFRKAAHLGHAGAAYMLGELLLDGVGVRRDRASALEWIVTAAELGHYKARQRVLSILQQDWEDLELGKADAEEEETLQWSGMSDEAKAKAILIERRYTIGGGSRNPEVLQKRKTKVSESRDGG